jgi:hypothetical protein
MERRLPKAAANAAAAALLRRAAARCARSAAGGCAAIGDECFATWPRSTQTAPRDQVRALACHAFANLQPPAELRQGLYWWQAPHGVYTGPRVGRRYDKRERTARVLGLLFAAEIAAHGN